MRAGSLMAVLGAIFVAGQPVAAQRFASLAGHVLDTSGGGISGAVVTVTNQETGFRRSVESDIGGAYAVSPLEAGVYKTTVRKEGFRTLVRFGMPLEEAQAEAADFVLPVGSMLETITVEGTPSPLDREDAARETGFEHDEITRLPLNGGGLLQLLDAAPGTNITPATRGEAGQFTTAGQRPNTNYFTVDGVSANNGVTAGGIPAQSTGGTLPAVSAFGSLDSLISPEVVDELSIRTSSTGAEMGRLPGAQIAITSQSGANQWHGSIAYEWRNEVLAANDWFANQASLGRGAARISEISQTLGGPVRANRTFVFVSFQHLGLTQPYVWNQPVPSLAARQTAGLWAQPVLGIYPAPNEGALATGIGNWAGRSEQPASLNAGSARADQAIGSRVSLFGRYSDAPSENQYGAFQVNRIDLRFQSLTLGLTAHPTARIIVSVRANESQSSAYSVWNGGDGATGPGCQLQPLTTSFLHITEGCNYLVRFTIGGIGQLVSGEEGSRRQRQFQTTESLAFHLARHDVQVGVDDRRVVAIRRDATAALGVIADDVAALATEQNLWIAQSAAVDESAGVTELSLWIQDTWRASSRFTVTAGLRWEFSPAPVPSGDTKFLDFASGNVIPFSQISSLCCPAVTALWPTSYRDFAPRLGFAWRLTGDGKTVLRAGGGLYYDSSMSIAADSINGGPLSVASYTGATGLFPSELSYAFLPNLRLPAAAQWNVSLERALGAHDTVSVGYVGSAGYDLIRREVGGAGSSATSWIALTTNNGHSGYHALEAQYRRRFTGGLNGLASYTWSHAIDNDSSDAFLLWAGFAAPSDRGASDFDLRHSFTATLSYTVPQSEPARGLRRLAGGWSLSAILRARSGFPITVLESEEYTGISLTNAFRPLLLLGQPLWLGDQNVPGGRRLNPAAFLVMPSGQQGDLGRNAIDGFGMVQLDAALSRDFPIREKVALQFRVDAFNALNHPNFADPVRYLDNPLFGQSASMLNMMLGTGSPGSGLSPLLGSGGPRMLQLGLRLHF
ncbi:MAG: carboxypeptidase regulatory-like domain-containing protein [Bryobacteraceae bacterium]